MVRFIGAAGQPSENNLGAVEFNEPGPYTLPFR